MPKRGKILRKAATARKPVAARRRNAKATDALEENAALKRELRRSKQQQAATAEVLKAISRSGFDLRSVLETLLASAARLCNADNAYIYLREGSAYRLAACSGFTREFEEFLKQRAIAPGRDTLVARTASEARIVHIRDVLVDAEYKYSEAQSRGGFRSMLGIPMLRDDVPMGVLSLSRSIVKPFTAKQIELVSTFADQAAIAIENARLLDEVQGRTSELTEALEQQTATADVLKVISTSPTDVQPVFDTIVRRAMALCDSLFANVYRFDGEMLHLAASQDADPRFERLLKSKYPMRPDVSQVSGRALLTKSVVRVEDARADPQYDQQFSVVGWRKLLGVPMLRNGVPLGVVVVGWVDPGPIPKAQEELLKTFTDQAAIAIQNVRLFDEVQARTKELSQALEQQTATSEVLEVISRSKFELQPVFDVLVESACRLCEAERAFIYRFDGTLLRGIASHNVSPELLQFVERNPLTPGRHSGTARAALERRTVHIHDVRSDPDYTYGAAQVDPIRTVLGVPMLKADELVGVIMIYRLEVKPFSDTQIALIETFADQAVIAIENVRLFDEVQARTLELSELLKQQTATADVLKVISRSTFDLQPVLDVLVESACRLCEADQAFLFQRVGDVYRAVAGYGASEAFGAYMNGQSVGPGRGTLVGRVVQDSTTVHLLDATADPEYTWRETTEAGSGRTMLGVPLLRDGTPIGAISLTRRVVKPFSDSQIELVTTFADQAVIAIENVRLFDEVQARTKELSQALEQQTATSEVLQVISRSTFDLQVVLDTLVESATRLCGADHSWIFQREGDFFSWAAGFGHATEEHARIREYFKGRQVPVDRGSITGRSALEARVIHVHDVLADANYTWSGAQQVGGYRAALGVPLLRDGNVVGVIFLAKTLPEPFTSKQMELATTFADQAVIAIENVRLFDEVQARTNELTESLKQQTATADVLKVISRSAFDLETVLQTLVESAANLCEADKATITRQKDGVFFRAESYGFSDEFMAYVRQVPIVPGRETASGRALLEGRVVHIADVQTDTAYDFGEAQRLGDYRTMLAVPMLRNGVPAGVIVLTRPEVRPFTDKQIELASTFADQAAIAIENVRLFESVEARTRELARSLEDLRAAQDRLVQTEKLASLGQLTAGIAHEIKNPLNFVNNFSAVSIELVDELKEALQRPLDDKARAEAVDLMEMLAGNLDKVVQHGKRADSIVKNMLLHSRANSGERRPVDINSVVEESLNLAYHGARAEKPGFNITLERSFDPTAGEVDVFPQDITRVLLNLISNGFYATSKRLSESGAVAHEPTLAVVTRNLGDRVEIRIRDNGTGIPADVKDKMFNPFFTTKPAGEGTGLGLSLSHDIVVKQHAGTIEVDSRPGEFTEFRVVLPRSSASAVPPGGRA